MLCCDKWATKASHMTAWFQAAGDRRLVGRVDVGHRHQLRLSGHAGV